MAQAQDIGNGVVKLPSGTQLNVGAYLEAANSPQGAGEPLSQADLSALYDYAKGKSFGTPSGDTIAFDQYGNTKYTQTPYKPSAQDQLLGIQGQNIQQNATNNDAIFNNLQGWQTGAFAAQNGLQGQNQTLAQSGMDTANWLGGVNQGLSDQSWQSAMGANAGNSAALGNYAGALQSATNWDLGNYGQLSGDLNAANSFNMGNYTNLANTAAGMSQLQARGYGADVQSQAQYAQADPQSIAAQYQALGQLQGAANGSLNVTSQAAQAYANAGDVANQENAANALQGIANGSKDVDFWGINGINDLSAAAAGSKDVHVGQEDPAAFASAHDALQHLTDLSNPSVTPQEQFIYEQARQQQEQDERASREAVMTNLRQRGMSGSGQQIGQEALAGQGISQNRLLSDLGAQSTAVQRAMTALGGQADLASQLSAQGNQVAESNAANQLAALQQFAGIGAQVAVSDKDRQAAAQQAASNAYATLRAQGFSEEYARGQAADIVNTANSDRQLNAMNASGQLASNMRAESFNEDFSTKSAADQMAQFNKSQSQITQRFQDQYAADQQNAAWGRATDVASEGNYVGGQMAQNAATRFSAGNTVGRNFATDQGNLFQGTIGVNQANNSNIQGSLGLQGGFAQSTANAKLGADQLGISANNGLSSTYAQQLAAMTNLGIAHVGNNTNNTQLTNQQIQSQLGATAAQSATDEAKRQYDEDPGGLLGTGLLGKNGIFGIKGIPLF
jgi:hypothetical protein